MELKALRRLDESWVLILEELVWVGKDYYRPRRVAVRGPQEILDTVERLGTGELVSATKRAMTGSHTNYRITGDALEQWHSSDGPSSGRRETRQRRDDRAQQSRLETLEERVHALEATIRQIGRSLGDRRSRHGTGDSDANRPIAPEAMRRETPQDQSMPKAQTPPAGQSTPNAKSTAEPHAQAQADPARNSPPRARAGLEGLF